jgi:activator of HSP90 ATPase
MKTIEQKHRIKAPIEKVWQALVNSKIIEKWGGGPAKMDDKEGTDFKLWGGDIHGKNITVIKNEILVQDWFSGKWKNPSRVTFKLTQKENQTELNLIQKNVPEEDAMDISQGWKEYYIGPIRAYLEK